MSLLINPFEQRAFIDGVEVPMPPSASHIWDGETWVLPEPEPEVDHVPSSITRFQARTQLHIKGLLNAADEAASNADTLVQIAWAGAQSFMRDGPNIAAIATAISLSDDEVDELFREASKITA